MKPALLSILCVVLTPFICVAVALMAMGVVLLGMVKIVADLWGSP